MNYKPSDKKKGKNERRRNQGKRNINPEESPPAGTTWYLTVHSSSHYYKLHSCLFHLLQSIINQDFYFELYLLLLALPFAGMRSFSVCLAALVVMIHRRIINSHYNHNLGIRSESESLEPHFTEPSKTSKWLATYVLLQTN